MSLDDNCIFCKIIKGEIPNHTLVETDMVLSFLDINPIADGHSLFIPKYHAEKLHDVPDEYLNAILIEVKKVANAAGFENYNVLQNNGKLAGQEVNHVHFHLIPRTDKETGLSYRFSPMKKSAEELAKYAEDLRSKL